MRQIEELKKISKPAKDKFRILTDKLSTTKSSKKPDPQHANFARIRNSGESA
jgi:hypothetical protein